VTTANYSKVRRLYDYDYVWCR